MAFRRLWFSIFSLLSLVDTVAVAAEPNHPRIAGIERFFALPLAKSGEEAKSDDEAKSDQEEEEPVPQDPVTGGRILLSELNCVSCHQVKEDAKPRLKAKQAPILDEVGGRVKVEWIRNYLSNPHTAKPGTTMPNVIESLPESERASSVEALSQFLASTGAVVRGSANSVAASKGATLFRTVGCLACHNSLDEKSPILATSVLLTDLGKKYTTQSLMTFLKDPLKSRPSGRMPNMGLSDEDYRNIAHFFVRDGNMPPNVRFALYHGSWKSLPKFGELNPVSEGDSVGFDLSVADRPNEFGIQFTSYLQITKPGDYEFWLGSDDGSKLSIDGELVVDCDGIHPHQLKEGRAVLATGFHKVEIEYFQGGGEASLEPLIAGPGIVRQPLSGLTLLEPKADQAVAESPEFVVDSQLVAKGRKLFATIGCAACHQMTIDGQRIGSEIPIKPLAEIDSNKGCLAEVVTGKSPRYELSQIQRTLLASAISSKTDESPAETVHRTLATLNCYGCHQRGKQGGVEAARDATFETLQKEMGDEGRLPPVLTGVGDKLRTDWLRNVLNNGATDRKNYMLTRMPKFGTANIEGLDELFAAVDRPVESMPKADFTEPEFRVKAAGRHLVGGHALSCIKCHDFGPYPSTGIRAINLTTMSQRLRVDWFYRYVLDPQTYRRGTRMPTAWPFGKATIRDTLNANVNQQVQAVWTYLSDAEKAAVPFGLVREPIELKPQSDPVIYRNFIEGAGSRAIGVGYPEGVNLAFDANQMRLAMIWHGAFIDASRHWTGRGQGFEPPLGDDVIPLPNQVPFLVLERPDREFPTGNDRSDGYRFLGYHLDPQQRPIFRYSLPGITIEDHPIPVTGTGQSATLKRILKFEGTADTSQLWFRTATAETLKDLGDGHYRVDGIWTIEIDAGTEERPLIRESAGKKELLIPIRLRDGKAEIRQNYVW